MQLGLIFYYLLQCTFQRVVCRNTFGGHFFNTHYSAIPQYIDVQHSIYCIYYNTSVYTLNYNSDILSILDIWIFITLVLFCQTSVTTACIHPFTAEKRQVHTEKKLSIGFPIMHDKPFTILHIAPDCLGCVNAEFIFIVNDSSD